MTDQVTLSSGSVATRFTCVLPGQCNHKVVLELREVCVSLNCIVCEVTCELSVCSVLWCCLRLLSVLFR